MEEGDAGAVLTFLREALPTDELDEQQLLALAASARTARFPAGETILHQGGEPADHLYLIRSGHVEIRVDGQLIDLPGAGEVFGELSLVAGSAPTATVRASEDVECRLARPRRGGERVGDGGRGFLRAGELATRDVAVARHRRPIVDRGDRARG